MLHDPMTEKTLDELETGVRAQVNKDRPREDVVREKVIVSDDGYIGVTAEMLFASIREAGRKVANPKVKSRGNISTATSTTLPSFLSIREEFLPFQHIPNNGSFGWLKSHTDSGLPDGVKEEDIPWVSDRRRGVLNSGGKTVAVAIRRPKFASGWKLKVTVDIDETEIDPTVVKKLFEVAGRVMGLGSFRPNCSGTFGRSLVTAWREIASEPSEMITEAVASNGKNGRGKAKTAQAGA